jgi:hypothetical protein
MTVFRFLLCADRIAIFARCDLTVARAFLLGCQQC